MIFPARKIRNSQFGNPEYLGDLLFRCVRDTSHLEGIFTDPAYVDVWLKLIDYCDYPLELFSLLFTNGVGTLSARFYLAWVGRLRRTAAASGDHALDAKGTNQIASILIHGLRAYAQPIETLESYAESFLHFVEGEGRLEQEQHDFERITSESKPNRPDEVRHKLASLRVVGTVTSGASANVPVIRTGNAVNVSQRGLPSLQTRPPAPVPQRPPTGLQVFRDEPTTEGSDGRPPFLRSRAPAPNVKSVSRLAEPLPNWNAENTTRSDLTVTEASHASGLHDLEDEEEEEEEEEEKE
nr:unnamed protein product [Spirometra erinaceieuropaei]